MYLGRGREGGIAIIMRPADYVQGDVEAQTGTSEIVANAISLSVCTFISLSGLLVILDLLLHLSHILHVYR